MQIIKGIRILLIINMIYLICTMQWIQVLVVASVLLVSFLPEALKFTTGVELTKFMNYFFIVFVLLSQWCGTYLRAYDVISWWDLFLHGLSAFVVGLGGLVILRLCDPELMTFKNQKYGLISIIIFLTISSSAVFWEIFEFVGDTFFGTNAQLGSLRDTMEDMFICVIIGIIFSFWIYRSLRKGKDNFVTKQMNEFMLLNKDKAK